MASIFLTTPNYALSPIPAMPLPLYFTRLKKDFGDLFIHFINPLNHWIPLPSYFASLSSHFASLPSHFVSLPSHFASLPSHWVSW